MTILSEKKTRSDMLCCSVGNLQLS